MLGIPLIESRTIRVSRHQCIADWCAYPRVKRSSSPDLHRSDTRTGGVGVHSGMHTAGRDVATAPTQG